MITPRLPKASECQSHKALQVRSDWRMRIHLASEGSTRNSAWFGALPTQTRDIALLVIDTGLGVGEALKLGMERREPSRESRLRSRARRRQQEHKSRTVSLTARLPWLLQRHQQKSGLVFRSENGSQRYHAWIDQHHAAVRKALDLPDEFVLHSLRHTFGTQLGEAGANAFTIMSSWDTAW
jgi:integrase